MNIKELKQEIRQQILLNRKQLSAELRVQYSNEIVQQIVGLPEYQAANNVLGYMNFDTEFASDLWAVHALAEGKQLFLPKVNRTTHELDIYRVTDLQHDLAAGLWNIREPLPERCSRLVSLKEVDFILLPGVAFGRDGSRLGYGGGFYDKLLARLTEENEGARNPALVAGAYSLQFVDNIPQELTDRKVQWLVTEDETIDCSRFVTLSL